MVVVALPRAGAESEGVLAAPGGTWRDVLRGEERSFSGNQPIDRVTDDYGTGVFERI